MSAQPEDFLVNLRAFADAEGVRANELNRPMEILNNALGRVVSVDDRPPQPSQPVVAAHLANALDAATNAVGGLIRSIVDRVGWAAPYPEYAGESDMDAMRANYAYAPIVGGALDVISAGSVFAPYISEEVFVGLVLQGPNCDYPSHVHKAEEVFWVAAGTADWQRGDAWRVDGPGAVIHHLSGTRHATITREEPLLMLFAWVSDPGSIPVIIRD
tara:strand:- start:3350 stop:3994 length:645 start_codon:yes stop_codon:yes gene_type:complete